MINFESVAIENLNVSTRRSRHPGYHGIRAPALHSAILTNEVVQKAGGKYKVS